MGLTNLLYDGYNNTFLPLTLTSTHGAPRNSLAGGKTAVIMSANGYLFGYAPGVSTPIEEKLGDDNVNLTRFELSQNYPNPFNPSTTIEFSIPKSGFVTLKIYNLLGQEVTTLVNDKLSPNKYKYIWDATNYSSGIYFYKLVAGKYIKIKKMILMK